MCPGAGGGKLPQAPLVVGASELAVFDVRTRLVAPKGIITKEVALMLICRTVLNFGRPPFFPLVLENFPLLPSLLAPAIIILDPSLAIC